MRIAVLIPTFRRPTSLLETLTSLEGQSDLAWRIIVSDNDPCDQEGIRVADLWRATSKIGSAAILTIATDRGLSQNRNHGLSVAFQEGADAVVMIDDDARASADWLKNLRPALERGCDIVGGPTIYEFPEDIAERVRRANMFSVPYAESGFVPRLRSANNCGISRQVYDRYSGMVFDPSFGKSGGEDMNLFVRERREKTEMWWSADAKVYERVPIGRCSFEWLADRHRTSAINSARVDRNVYGLAAFPRQIFMAGKDAVSSLVHTIKGSDSWTVRERRDGALGRIQGLIGSPGEHDSSKS